MSSRVRGRRRVGTRSATLVDDGLTAAGGGLARSSLTDVDQARTHRDVLISRAAAVQRAAGHDPAHTDCADAGCALASTPDGVDICVLTRRLARLHDEVAIDRVVDHAVTRVEDAVAQLLTALPDAVDAVRECRRSTHASSRCWFADDPGFDGCAEVLRAAHRFGR